MDEKRTSGGGVGRPEGRVRRLMDQAGFESIAHLAENLSRKYPHLSVNRATLSRLLNGKRPRPNIHLMYAVARELDVTLDALYELVAQPQT